MIIDKDYDMSECNLHPAWQPVGLQWQCPYCATPTKTKRLTAKQAARVAAAGNAVRVDDLSGGAWNTIRLRIRERDEYQCRACKRAVLAGVVDHIIALFNGGTNADSNLQLLCTDCHTDKTNVDLGRKVRRHVGADGIPEGW